MSITAEGVSSKEASVLIEEQMIPHHPVPAAYGWMGVLCKWWQNVE